MISQGKKQWIIAILFTAVAVLSIYAFISSKDSEDDPQVKEYSPPPVPKSLMEFNEQERQFSEALRKDPENAELRARLGDLYFENARFEKAIQEYQKVLVLNAQDVDTYNDLGLALHYTGRSGTAIDTLKKGTAVNPSFQRIWLSLGFVLASTGRNEEAREILQKAIQINPDTDIGVEAERMLKLINKPS